MAGIALKRSILPCFHYGPSHMRSVCRLSPGLTFIAKVALSTRHVWSFETISSNSIHDYAKDGGEELFTKMHYVL